MRTRIVGVRLSEREVYQTEHLQAILQYRKISDVIRHALRKLAEEEGAEGSSPFVKQSGKLNKSFPLVDLKRKKAPKKVKRTRKKAG